MTTTEDPQVEDAPTLPSRVDTYGGGILDRPDDITDEVWVCLAEAFTNPSDHPFRIIAEWALRVRRDFDGHVRAHEALRDTLERRMETMERDRDEARSSVIDRERAIETIGEMLQAEARERGWCSEYETFVERVNDELGRQVLIVRKYRHTVTVHASFVIETDYGDDRHAVANEVVRDIFGDASDHGAEDADWSIQEIERNES